MAAVGNDCCNSFEIHCRWVNSLYFQELPEKDFSTNILYDFPIIIFVFSIYKRLFFFLCCISFRKLDSKRNLPISLHFFQETFKRKFHLSCSFSNSLFWCVIVNYFLTVQLQINESYLIIINYIKRYKAF